MDGHFVPNISFGPHVVNCIKKIVNVPLEVHLMISHPLNFLHKFSSSNTIIFHYESNDNPFEVIDKIKRMNQFVGISIKPRTSIDQIIPFLDYVDLVLIMTVEPGFGGQSFMHNQIEKIKKLRKIVDSKRLNVEIEVDGGINYETGKICAEKGASILVSGSYIFSSDNINGRINLLKSVI